MSQIPPAFSQQQDISNIRAAASLQDDDMNLIPVSSPSSNQHYLRAELQTKTKVELRTMAGDRRHRSSKQALIESILGQSVLPFVTTTAQSVEVLEPLPTPTTASLVAFAADKTLETKPPRGQKQRKHKISQANRWPRITNKRSYTALARRINKQRRKGTLSSSHQAAIRVCFS